ncbi:SPRY domain-containing protein 7-like [Polyodon spathula]|uniref:SPRY domain-containing protein 7-like n=1 Tax=Polyodon spathula TaxID=7913 RepID=UPI001B7ED084|nr:SPRY domain-containing protein 7-like [Polyodon spathula]
MPVSLGLSPTLGYSQYTGVAGVPRISTHVPADFSKLLFSGVWGIGVATQKVNLNQIPFGRDVHSLVLRQDGSVYHNNEEKNRLPANSIPQEGDIVGITYDHVELNMFLNGKNMHCPASGIRGTVFPVVYVDDSAILDCQFSEFYYTPPQGFEKILFEQQIF